MKKAVFKNTLALALVAIATQASAQVTLYEREGFQGESFTTRRQVPDFGRFGFNDRASSVVVGGEGWERWQVCEDARFAGRCVVLRPGQYPTLQAMGLNNRISSVQAVARVDSPPPPSPSQTSGSVVFYEKEGFGGRSFTTQTELGDLGRSGFNDRISAIEVFGGPWEVCADAGFGGKCAVLRPGKYPSLMEMGLDNRISSVRALGHSTGPAQVAPQVIFYERENFSGRSFVAQADVPDFGRGGFNDRASSVEVVGGWFEVCQGGGYSGQCAFLRPGKYPSLVSMGLNNRISSVRLANGDARALDNRLPPPAAAFYDPRRRDNEQLFEANVVAVRAVVGPPEQRCWVDRDQVAVESGRSNIGAGIAGAVIGGILGHQIGDGRGRDLATVGGAIAGGALGASVGRDGRSTQTQDVQRCTSVPSQTRADLWDVTYSFRGQEHRVQMTSPPGATIIVNRDGEPRV
jgi:uncharacterized protein YcfJ